MHDIKLFQTAQMESEISTKSLNKIQVIIEMRSTQLEKNQVSEYIKAVFNEINCVYFIFAFGLTDNEEVKCCAYYQTDSTKNTPKIVLSRVKHEV